MPEVSRDHARLRAAEDAVEVHDLESKNGVYVNERRVSVATLALGDEVRFGPVGLRLEAIEKGVLDARLEKWDRKADLPRIAVPTLVIGAQHDTMDPEHMRGVAGR